MFIENFKESVRVFKLVTGEEVISKIVAESASSYTLNQPLQIVMGNQGLQFAPLMMLAASGKDIDLNKSSVVAVAQPAAELEGQYESITTGIVLPKKSSIIT